MRKRLLHTLGLVFAALVSIPLLYAQSGTLRTFDFRHFGTGDGLAQGHVKAILEDDYGFMWFGTKNGLMRYDGVNVQHVNCYDPEAQRGNDNIGALMEEKGRCLWVGTDAGVYQYDFRRDLFTFFAEKTKKGLQITNWIKDIRADGKGNIWIVVPNQGVFRYDGTRLHHYYITHPDRYVTENPECICIRRNGEVWVGTNHAGLFRYDARRDRFEQFMHDSEGNTFAADNIYALCEYGGKLAVACHEGALRTFDLTTHRIGRIVLPGVEFSVLRDVECFDGKHLWLGTAGGLYIIEETQTSPRWNHYTENVASSMTGLSDNVIYTIATDRSRNVWLGTMFGGVSYYLRNTVPFTSYVAGPSSLSSRKVRGLAHGADGRIWIGTEDGGLNVLNPQTNEIHAVAPEFFHRAGMQQVLTVVADGDKIVCGLFKSGLVEIDCRTEQVRHVTPKELGLTDEGSVGSYFRDSRGTLWVANLRRVYRMNPATGRLEPFGKIQPHWIEQIFEDKTGGVWFASNDSGVYRYDERTGRLDHYVHDEADAHSIGSNAVNGGMVDSRGNVWFSTDRSGISCFDSRTRRFNNYSKREGLPDNTAYGIVEDAVGHLWFGTNEGLVRFAPADTSVVLYTYEDGLPANRFNYNSTLRVGNDRFYMGTLGGLLTFTFTSGHNTKEVKQPTFPLRLTRLLINSEEQHVGGEDSPLSESLLFTREIRLDYDQNNLTLDFAALKMGAGHSLSYYYKLESTDKEWCSTPPSLTFSKLPPGSYVLRLRAIDPQTGARAETELAIVVRPPWWRSTLAYLFYIVALALLVTFALRKFRDRTAGQFREKQRLFELEKEKELFRSKVEFFTEISHEIRTPLTLINSSLEAISSLGVEMGNKVSRHLSVMSQNVRRLLDLNHQLLDFRKVGMQRFLLSFTHVDVARLLRDTVERFEPAYQQNGKSLRFEPFEVECRAAIDKEAVGKVRSKLLNNGLKYAASTAIVRLSATDTDFTVTVSSDGERIDSALSERIFTPFFRIQQEEGAPFGVGIGLPMARTLAELHHGRLYLDPHAAWNDFVLVLPRQQDNVVRIGEEEESEVLVENVARPEVVAAEAPVAKAGRSVVLLVEDNTQVQSVVGDRLREFFNVEQAYNGEEALTLLHEKAVDIVVTDIMMPVMDGVELCRHIKEDDSLSHLPVVFLTAKNMTEDRIGGLRIGAEAYIEKPFAFEVLKETIGSILTNRRRAQELFSKRPVVPVQNLKMNKYNEEFMQKLIACVQRNFLNESFGVEAMADEFCMSRSALLRKIKSLTNLSAIEFIKVVRLRHAAELIKEGKYRIAEIGYMVGFSTPSYFGKLFQKQFGMTPKKFEQMCLANEPTENLLGNLVAPQAGEGQEGGV